MPTCMNKLRWPLHFGVMCMFANGCASQPPQSVALNLPPPKPQHVDFANLTARTSAVDAGASVSADELLARVNALQAQESSPARIQRLIERFPDAALEALRDTSAAQASQPERTAVAAAYDRAFITGQSSGWTGILTDGVLHPAEYESIHQARQLALQFIEMGRPERVFTEVHIPDGSAFSFAKAELLRIEGIAALLCERPSDALRDWQSAEELARADCSVYAELCLLEAEALRNSGTMTDSQSRWSLAVISARSVCDPALWERFLDARDESAQWPAEIADTFRHSLKAAPATAPFPNEPASSAQIQACIWRQIGEWRFARGENPGALLAFKQAESLFVLTREKAEARISEARVLLTINQSGAAVSMLTAMTADPDPQISHHALAVLGNARVALDDISGALTLLQAAVTGDDQFPLGLRASARADLGLVCLMSSREQEGLSWLHRAQADFEADHDNADLVQSLQNEAAYLDQAGQAEQARLLRERISLISAIY